MVSPSWGAKRIRTADSVAGGGAPPPRRTRRRRQRSASWREPVISRGDGSERCATSEHGTMPHHASGPAGDTLARGGRPVGHCEGVRKVRAPPRPRGHLWHTQGRLRVAAAQVSQAVRSRAKVSCSKQPHKRTVAGPRGTRGRRASRCGDVPRDGGRESGRVLTLRAASAATAAPRRARGAPSSPVRGGGRSLAGLFLPAICCGGERTTGRKWFRRKFWTICSPAGARQRGTGRQKCKAQ